MSVIISQTAHPTDKNAKVDLPAVKNGALMSKVKVAEHQAVAYHHLNQVRIHVIDTAPATTAFTGGNNEVRFRIRENSMQNWTSSTFRFKITEASQASMILAPVPLWFDRIEVWTKNGSGEKLFWIYGENILQALEWSNTNEQRKLIQKPANLPKNYYQSSANTHKSNEIRWYSLPLQWALDQIKPNLQNVDGDLLIRFYCKNGIVVSGSGTPSLTDVQLVADEEHHNHNFNHDDKLKNSLSRDIHATQFVEPVLVQEESVALTTGTKYRVNLENVKGNCAFLTLQVRSSVANAANAVANNADLGPNCFVDVESTTGTSLWSNGSQVSGDYILNDLARKHFSSDYSGKSFLYYVPFCDNPLDALLHGHVSGYMNLEDKKYLAFTPDASAPVSYVYSVDLSATSDAGTIRFTDPWGNQTGALAFNASAATCKAALDALPFFAEQGLTSTFSAAPNADFTITIAGRDVSLMDGNTIGVQSALTASGAAVSVTSVSTATVGRRGFTAGTYVVTVYAYVFKGLMQHKNHITLA